MVILCLKSKGRTSAKFRCQSAADGRKFRCRPTCPNRIYIFDITNIFKIARAIFEVEMDFSPVVGERPRLDPAAADLARHPLPRGRDLRDCACAIRADLPR